CDGALIVRLPDSARELQSLQFISGVGEKRFLPGGAVAGCYFAIVGSGDKNKDVIVISEGFATGASCHEATGRPVAIAFDASNLLKVATAVLGKFPAAQIIIAADNDVGSGRNTGLEEAQSAAAAVYGLVAVPELDGRKCD